MSRLNRSRGNMYDWVSHTWSPLIGCPHQCAYCYVRTGSRAFPITPEMNGPFPSLGKEKTIFVGHLCDLFASGIDDDVVLRVLEHCKAYQNKYVFQTKNPERMYSFLDVMPEYITVGTTIETNRQDVLDGYSRAPSVAKRATWIRRFPATTFVTIEPIMDFDLESMVGLLLLARPTFVNIGADSKRHNLPEPTRAKVLSLVKAITDAGGCVRKKMNLERLGVL